MSPGATFTGSRAHGNYNLITVIADTANPICGGDQRGGA